jgi:hypothetical protein
VKKLLIKEFYRTNNTCTLYLANVRRNDKIRNCLNLINNYIKDRKAFFELYRVDGFNLTNEEIEVYTEEIGDYFNKLECFDVLIKQNGLSLAEGILTAVGKLSENNDIYGMLPKIFDYYLETTLYQSELISFDDFKQFVLDNPMKGMEYYIENGISNIAFAHVDSGDFMVCFNTNVYNKTDVINSINSELN